MVDILIKTEQIESEFVSTDIYKNEVLPSEEEVCCLCTAGNIIYSELINLIKSCELQGWYRLLLLLKLLL
jgi:hypothetical protein